MTKTDNRVKVVSSDVRGHRGIIMVIIMFIMIIMGIIISIRIIMCIIMVIMGIIMCRMIIMFIILVIIIILGISMIIMCIIMGLAAYPAPEGRDILDPMSASCWVTRRTRRPPPGARSALQGRGGGASLHNDV